MTEFLDMGGHAVWVWSTYALSLCGLAFVTWLARRQRRKAEHWRALAEANEGSRP